MKILYVTTVGCTMVFFKELIRQLLNDGHVVEIATNETSWQVPEYFRELGCKIHHISTSRSPLNIGNFLAIKEIRKLVIAEKYNIVHCHTPNASVVARLACRNLRKTTSLRVFYTSHGFHFHKGASITHWIPFYYVEKYCSRFTDKLITINKEDFSLAKNKFHTKDVVLVPGVGIDLSKFNKEVKDVKIKRQEIGVQENAFLLFSVGELSKRKNHEVVLKSLGILKNPYIHYAIAGEGKQKAKLLRLANKLGISSQIHFLGFRKDIVELNKCSDVFVFPSRTEGMGIAAIEAMACGKPIITSNVHGINDYSIDGVTGYKFCPKDYVELSKIIKAIILNQQILKKMGELNKERVKKYNINNVIKIMQDVYQS